MRPSPAVPLRHRPIFIAGAPGTGSTLLRLMLDSHENLAFPQETGFLRLAAVHQWVPYWDLGGEWAHHLGLTEDEMWVKVADFYGGLFASYAAERGKVRWGDKTPLHVWHLEFAQRLYPEMVVVGIVRHPSAVVASQRRRFRRGVAEASGQWRRSTTALLQQAATLGDRCVVVRYEDLVGDPEGTMRPLLDWLGEPWSDQVLAHHEVQPRSGGPGQVEGFTRTDTAISTARVDAWSDLLRGEDLEKVARKTGALAAFLGYDPRQGEITTTWATDPPFLTGTQIRALQATSDINWGKPIKLPRADRAMKPRQSGRKRHGRVTIDQVKVPDLLRHRLIEAAHRLLPDKIRAQANEVRRKNPTIDRMIGPR